LYSLVSIALIIFSVNSQTSGHTIHMKKNMSCVCKINLTSPSKAMLLILNTVSLLLLNRAVSEANYHLCKLELERQAGRGSGG
jgi:hypothetical protein